VSALSDLLRFYGVDNKELLDALDWKYKKIYTEKEMAIRERDKFREASDKLFWSGKEFIDDWKKGDFSLSTLAAADAQSLDDALARYSIAITKEVKK
jgi:hypothetical protein